MNLLNNASPASSSSPSVSTRTTPLRSSTIICLMSSLLLSSPSEKRKPTAKNLKPTGEQSKVTNSLLVKMIVKGDSVATTSSPLLLPVSVSFNTGNFSVSLSILLYPYIISISDAAAVNHPGEYHLPGHDALPYLLADGATTVALLANLGDIEEDILANGDFCAYGQGEEFNPLGGEIFGKIAGPHLEALSPHLVYAFHRQQAYLPVGATVSVCIADKAVILLEDTFGCSFLSGTFLFTLADGDYFGH